MIKIPKELREHTEARIWGLFLIEEDKKTPYVNPSNNLRMRCNDARSLMTYKEACACIGEHKDQLNLVLSISLQLLKQESNLFWSVIDIDAYNPKFDQSLLENLLSTETYIDISPSGKGYHLWFISNYRVVKSVQSGVDSLNKGWVTISGKVYRNDPIYREVIPDSVIRTSYKHLLKANRATPALKDISKGKYSIVYAFNTANTLTSVLLQNGYIPAGTSFRSPRGESGSAGVNLADSFKNPWQICYSHHTSDEYLCGRTCDAFDMSAYYLYYKLYKRYPTNVVEMAKAKNILSAKSAKELHPVDIKTGEILTQTIDFYNKQAEVSASMGNKKGSSIDTKIEVETDQKASPPGKPGAVDFASALIAKAKKEKDDRKYAHDQVCEGDNSFSQFEKDVEAMPKYDPSFISSLPEPFPQLLSTFVAGIKTECPDIYCFTFLAIHETILLGKFRTGWGNSGGKNVNMLYVTGSPSSGGKNQNSTIPIEAYRRRLLSSVDGIRSDAVEILEDILTITQSDHYGATKRKNDYKERFSRGDEHTGGVAINTEASGFYKTLGKFEASQGEALASLDIALWDGEELPGASTSKTDVKSVKRPNISSYNLVQHKFMHAMYSENVIAKGYTSRVMENLAVFVEEEESTLKSFLGSKEKYRNQDNVNEDIFDFLLYVVNFCKEDKSPIQVYYTCREGTVLGEWNDKTMKPFISSLRFTGEHIPYTRIMENAEKRLTMVTAYCYLWRLYKGMDVSDLVYDGPGSRKDRIILDGSTLEHSIMPEVEYMLNNKIRCMELFSSVSKASSIEEILENAWNTCLSKVRISLDLKAKHPNKLPTKTADWPKGIKTFYGWTSQMAIPVSMYESTVMHKLEGACDGDTQKARQFVANWTDNNGLKDVKTLVTCGVTRKRNRMCYLISEKDLSTKKLK